MIDYFIYISSWQSGLNCLKWLGNSWYLWYIPHTTWFPLQTVLNHWSFILELFHLSTYRVSPPNINTPTDVFTAIVSHPAISLKSDLDGGAGLPASSSSKAWLHPNRWIPEKKRPKKGYPSSWCFTVIGFTGSIPTWSWYSLGWFLFLVWPPGMSHDVTCLIFPIWDPYALSLSTCRCWGGSSLAQQKKWLPSPKWMIQYQL